MNHLSSVALLFTNTTLADKMVLPKGYATFTIISLHNARVTFGVCDIDMVVQFTKVLRWVGKCLH